MNWTAWLQQFDPPVKQDVVRGLARALKKYQAPSVVKARLMASTSLLQVWLARNPGLAAHVDPAVWAEDLAEHWGWISAEPIVFID